MKQIIIAFFVLTSAAFISCNSGKSDQEDASIIENPSTASKPGASGDEPVMTFEKEHWDFGTINEGEVLEHTYSFTNTGGKNLLISDVQASCGCTVPVWPREPIKPGQSSSIRIQFNSSNKQEQLTKDVTIFSNANPVKKKLTFSAYVIKKPGSE